MAKINKNEPTASKRYIDLEIWQDYAQLPALGHLDFVALGMLFVPSSSSPYDYVAGGGTIVNKKRALTINTGAITATDTALDQVTKVGHGLRTGDGPIYPTATIGGVSTATPYYAIWIDDDTFAVATSFANAFLGVRVDITASLNGNSFSGTSGGGCQRSLTPWFRYTFTQAETNIPLNELSVMIDGAGYERAKNGGGYATATLEDDSSAWGSVELEAGITRDQAMRIDLRTNAAKFTKAGNDIVYRNMSDTDDSHGGTVTSGGRTAATANTIINAD